MKVRSKVKTMIINSLTAVMNKYELNAPELILIMELKNKIISK